MKNSFLYLLGGGLIYLIYKYKKTYDIFKNAVVNLGYISVVYFNKNLISFGICIKISNVKETTYITDSKLKIYLNGIYGAYCEIPYQQQIKANEENEIYLIANVYYKETFREIWNLLINSVQKIKIDISGKLKVNNIFVPIPQIKVVETSLQELISKKVTNE